MFVNLNLVLGIGLASLVGFSLIRVLSKPAVRFGKLLLRSACAFCLIWAANLVGGFFGFHLGLNLVSAFTVGLLGVPGVGLLLAIKYLI